MVQLQGPDHLKPQLRLLALSDCFSSRGLSSLRTSPRRAFSFGLPFRGGKSGNRGPRHVKSDLVRYLQLYHAVPETYDGPIDPARGQNPVSGLKVSQHVLNFPPLLLLRPCNKKIEDQDDEDKRQEELAQGGAEVGSRR